MAELEVSLTDGEYYYDVDPRPFCLSDSGEFSERGGYVNMFWVYCGNCGATDPKAFIFKVAAESWNNRE